MGNRRNTVTSQGRDRGERAVRAVLPLAAKIRATRAGRNAGLIVNGQAIEVKWIGAGNLGDVRSALKQRPKRNVILVARKFSPGASATLSDAGVNWADETGAAEISIGTILISRSGAPDETSYAIKRWTPAVIAVAEALLCGTKGTQAAMQEATGFSAGSCANALRYLTDEKLLMAAAKRGPASARQIVDRRQLLDAYATAVNAQPVGAKLQIGVTWQDILRGLSELGQRFDRLECAYAVTGAAAAAMLAPYLSSLSRATVYVAADSVPELEALAQRLKLRAIEGGRLTLKPFPSGTVTYLTERADEDLHVAPWPRIYADLLNEGVRGEEAAEHLYEVFNG